MTAILFDILILLALGLTVYFGARKGFIMSLCSLAAVIVALVGANLLADAITPMLADKLEPTLAATIQTHLDDYALQAGLTSDGLTAGSALASLKEQGGIYQWAAETMEQAFESELTQEASLIVAKAATAVAGVVTHSIVLLLGFILVLIAWSLVSHALDLMSRLPVINGLNHMLGGLFGLFKGVVLVWIVLWIACDLAGWITPEAAAQTHLLKLLLEHSPFRMLMVV